MLSSLPCFYAFCWSAIPTSCSIFNLFYSCPKSITCLLLRVYMSDIIIILGVMTVINSFKHFTSPMCCYIAVHQLQYIGTAKYDIIAAQLRGSSPLRSGICAAVEQAVTSLLPHRRALPLGTRLFPAIKDPRQHSPSSLETFLPRVWNCVLFSHSYHQCFDLEGESGIVVREIGTCVTQIPSCLSPSTIPVLLPTALQVGSVGNVPERYICVWCVEVWQRVWEICVWCVEVGICVACWSVANVPERYVCGTFWKTCKEMHVVLGIQLTTSCNHLFCYTEFRWLVWSQYCLGNFPP